MFRTKSIFVWALLSLLLLLATVGAIIPGIRGRVLGWWRGESFFDGQPLSVWSERLETEAKVNGDRPAFEQLKSGGKPAVPVIMAIAFSASGPRSQGQVLLASHGEAAVTPLVKVLKSSPSEDRRQAALVLGAIGPKAKPAVEPLVRLLDDDDEVVREAGMTALEQIGPQAAEAVPDLALILEGKGKTAAGPWLLQAARALGKIGPPARTAVPALSACLTNQHTGLVREVCLVLGGLGKDAAPAVPALIDILRKRESACDAAALALGNIGPDAKQAVPGLITAMIGTTRPELREACKIALSKMGADARPAVPALLAAFGKAAPIETIGPTAVPELIQLLANPEAADQTTVRAFLATFRKEAKVALVQALYNDKNPRLRSTVAALLGPAWGEAHQLVPPLIRALEDKDGNVREAARNSIVAFRKDAQPFLHQQLRAKNDARRLEAIQLLGRLGIEARSSARLLLPLLQEEDPALHPATVQALGKMDFHPKEAVPILIDALKARKQLDITLPLIAAHGRAAKDAIPLVCGLFQDADWRVRREAVFTLGQIGVDKEVGLAALTKALEDKNEAVRAAAAQALGTTRLLKDDVVPILMKLLQDPSEQVQGASLLALGRFGPASRAAVPIIHKIARATKEAPEGASATDSASPWLEPEPTDLRAACIMSLGGIGKPSQEAMPLLLSWLGETKSERMRVLIVEALGRMEAKEAAAAIKPLMQAGKGKLSAAAALALWRIEQSPAALTFLHEGLKDKTMPGHCTIALGKVGPAAGKSVPALIDILLREPDLAQRALAAEALGRMGPVNARPALRALVASLRISDAALRTQAARALGVFDEDARDAAARLVELLNDPESPQVRAAAADALLRIDPEAAANAGVL